MAGNGDGGSRKGAQQASKQTSKQTSKQALKQPPKAAPGRAKAGSAAADLDALLGTILDPKRAGKAPTAAMKRSAEQLVAGLGIDVGPGADREEVRRLLTEQLGRPENTEAVLRRLSDAVGRPPRPRSGPRPRPRPRPVPRPSTASRPPTSVRAKAGNGMALVSWKPAGAAVREYVVTTSRLRGGTPKKVDETVVSGTRTRTLVRNLDNGVEYVFDVHAVIVVGDDRIPGRPSRPTAPVIPTDEGPEGVVLLLLDDVPLGELFPNAGTDAARNLLTNADALGQKWRYEHLKVLAMKAAGDALEYENHIASLMAMTVSKISAAELLLNPTLISVVNRATDIGTTVLGLADAAPVTEIIGSLAGVATDALMLPRFLLWLSQTSPIGFWIGLFEALIEDVASFDTGLSRTNAYCHRVLNDDIEVLNAISDAAGDALDRLDTEVDAMVAPLRAAVSEVVQGTTQAMQEVFAAFDLPITFGVGDGTEPVANVDPLAGLEDELLGKVEELARDLKTRIATALQALRDAVTGGDGFATLVIVYLAIPILAFLVIAIAGGPFSAAALAAAVLLAAQELVHLILKLLTGPIMKQLDQVLALARDLTTRLREVLGDQASLIRAQSPARLLKVLATEMGAIKEIVPQEFLNAAATLLGDARDVVLSTATDLALAAEQALGHENATAFEAVASGYDTGLPRASRLPGGADPRHLGGAALLRDLGRLEEQRTTLADGKELELTQRLSLFRLLGGQGNPLAPTVPGAFPSFLSNGEALVKLTEGDLVDRMFPGLYRVLIKDVRVSGVLATGIGSTAGLTSGIPLTITHLGESRTRIKRGANPAAPPLQFPACDSGPLADDLPPLDPSGTSVTRRIRLEEWLEPGIGGVGGLVVRNELTQAFFDAAIVAAQGAAMAIPAGTAASVGLATIVAIIIALLFGLPVDEFLDDVLDVLRRPYVTALQSGVPAAVARAVENASCGFVDFATVKAGVEHLLHVFGLENVGFLEAALMWTAADFENRRNQQPPVEVFDDAIAVLVTALRDGASTERGTSPSMPDIVAAAYRDARTKHEHRMARWGKARLEEERDPQVRALGFATLVREQQAEAAAFNLVSTDAPFLGAGGGGQGQVVHGPPSLAPAMPSPTLQYRPFENRGIDGSLLLRLGDRVLPTLPVAGAPVSLTDLLKDIVLDVTVKGCFDPNLAAALRSSQQQNVDALKAFLPTATGVPALIGTLLDDRADASPRASERRTVHFSLRAHREKTRLQWLAVLDSTDPLLAAARGLLPGLLPAEDQLPLDVGQAFEPLGSVGDEFAFRFTFGQPPVLPLLPAATDILALARTLTISRAALGVADVLPGEEGAAGHVCSVGVAVVPMPSGVKTPTGDPLNVRLTVPASLRPFLGLPPGSGDVPLPDRLRMTTEVESVSADGAPVGLSFTPPTLTELFAAPGGTSLGVKMAATAITGLKVYDVILSISYYVRTLSAATTHSAVR